MSSVATPRHLFLSELADSFVKLHEHYAYNDLWQSCYYRDPLYPVYGDKSSDGYLGIDGIVRGLLLPMTRGMSDENFDANSMKAKCIFGSLALHGVLREDGVLFHSKAPSAFDSSFNRCLDIHGSRWCLCSIDAVSGELIYFDCSSGCLSRYAVPDNLRYCYSAYDGPLLAFGDSGVWSIPVSSNSVMEPVRVIDMRSNNCDIRMLGRSNNFSVFKYGAKTVVCCSRDVFELDIEINACYTFPTCMVLETPEGILLASDRRHASKIMELLRSFSIRNHASTVSDSGSEIQAMLDPVIAISMGFVKKVWQYSGWICANRKRMTEDILVENVIKDTPEYKLLRLSNNAK